MKNISAAYTNTKTIRLVRGGTEYFSLLLDLINKAVESIHIQVYIFDDDETGQMVASALKEAAKRNVQVYLMADGYASQVMSHSFAKELTQSGIHFRFFEPIFKSRYFYFGRRMHRKLVVVDAKYALAGGVNIADRYNDMPGKPAWLDFALYAEGEIAKQLCVLCWKSWKGYPTNMGKTPCEEKTAGIVPIPANAAYIRMRRNDWVRGKNEISASYIEMLRTVKHEVIFLCSYFLPGKIIRREMAHAVKRGVTIKVIAASFSDVMFTKRAERWLYDWLLRKDIKMYEYQDNILHGKLAVCDDEWMTIGSYNINDISAYASIELNLDVKDSGFVTQTRQMLDNLISNECIHITTEQHSKTKNIFRQFVRWFSYRFIRVVFYLFTFYFRQRP